MKERFRANSTYKTAVFYTSPSDNYARRFGQAVSHFLAHQATYTDLQLIHEAHEIRKSVIGAMNNEQVPDPDDLAKLLSILAQYPPVHGGQQLHSNISTKLDQALKDKRL